MQPTGRPGPAGQGRAERPQKYFSVRRESIGTRMVEGTLAGLCMPTRRETPDHRRGCRLLCPSTHT